MNLFESHKVITEDNYHLIADVFYPEGKSKGAILICNATAISRQFYYKYAKFISKMGYHVIVWNYRDIEEYHNEKYVLSTLKHWGYYDTTAMIDFAKKLLPNHKLLIFSHSIGGMLLGFAKNHHKIDGLIAYGVQSAYWRDWRFPYNIKYFILWHVLLPMAAKIMGYYPGRKWKMGTNLPYGFVKDWSKRFLYKDYLLMLRQYNLPIYFSDFSFNVFSFNFTDDPIATKKAVSRFFHPWPKNSLESIFLEPEDFGLSKVGHFDFFRSKYRNTLWKASTYWIDNFFE